MCVKTQGRWARLPPGSALDRSSGGQRGRQGGLRAEAFLLSLCSPLLETDGEADMGDPGRGEMS